MGGYDLAIVALVTNIVALVIYSSVLRIYRDKTMADKLMYIPNDDAQNNPFCRLLLVVVMFGHSTK